MLHSRLGDMGYWFEGKNIVYSKINGRCQAKGGLQVMVKEQGVLSHVKRVMAPYS